MVLLDVQIRATTGSEKKPSCFNLDGLVKRVPQINRSGDPSEDNRRTLVRRSLVTLLELFAEDQHLTTTTLNMVQMGMVADDSTEDKGDTKRPKTYTNIVRLPTYWKAALLTDVSTKELSSELLGNIDAKDEGAIDMIFSVFTQTTPEVFLPRACIVKATCRRFFAERVEQVGHRWKGWARRAVRPDGTIDWARGGPYTISWDGEGPEAKAVDITYINGDKCVCPPFLSIQRGFTCEHPHKDTEARLVKDGFGVPLSDLFQKTGDGPWPYRISSKDKDRKGETNPFNKLINNFQAECEEQATMAQAGQALCDQKSLDGDRQRMELKRVAAKQRAQEQATKKKGALAF